MSVCWGHDGHPWLLCVTALYGQQPGERQLGTCWWRLSECLFWKLELPYKAKHSWQLLCASLNFHLGWS